ncbi:MULTISPECIES: hypothetical protein [Arenibacter]|uniref:hypothetical protein n=1 Tax=Arenibacter TaxID=178469 RepID=UPI0012FFE5A8|nr:MULTISPECIES: hypothetical protein [Arenibacter]
MDVKIKLAGIWTSVMFCFVYGDFMGLYVPNIVPDIIDGKMAGIGKVTPYNLVGTSAMMIICSLMPFFSVYLKADINRIINMICAVLFIFIMLLTMIIGTPDSWDLYYWLFGTVEITLLLIAFTTAYKWPKEIN